MNVTIRRARSEDVDFIASLSSHEEVEPFLGAVSAKEPGEVAAEVTRSLEQPHDFGRFVIELDGARAGAMGFELANRRSRIAHLERLAVHPDFRGRRIADAAARLLQRELLVDLGYHRLQLEIYGFNERAIAHAERAGFVREGVRRRAYRRQGTWVDGVLYALVADEVDVPPGIALLHEYVGDHNECVRTGDWEPLAAWFAEDAELAFDGVPVGPFHGREAIAAAYRAQPPDDQVLTFRVEERDGGVRALYGWLAAPSHVSGRMLATFVGDKIQSLRVTFEQGLDWELGSPVVARFLHTMCRITDPGRSRAFYEALGFTFAGDFDIVRDGVVEATNYFFSLGDQQSVLELTYNHDGRGYDLGTGYGHIAIAVEDLDGTLERLKQQGIEPEREPYTVRDGGNRLCFVRDPDQYRIELIEHS